MAAPAYPSTPAGLTGTAPIIAPRWRGPAQILVATTAAVLLSLAVAFHDRTRGTAFDSWLSTGLSGHVGPTSARLLLDLTEPALTTGFSVVVAVVALLLRRWGVAVLAVVAPLAAILLAEVVLKPLVSRRLGVTTPYYQHTFTNGYAFPSGHETGLTSLTAELTLLVLRTRTAALGRGAAVALLAAWTLLGALGLVRNGYHYPTDTVGAITLCIAVVFGIALAVDAVSIRRRPRDDPASAFS